MKKISSFCLLILMIISCSKQEKYTQSLKPDVKGNELLENSVASRQNPDTCCPILLSETSPGVFETTQSYFGIHLVFNSFQLHGGFPYAKLISARAFGTPPGTNLYNIISEGLEENGNPQRNFVVQVPSCNSIIVKEKKIITQQEYYGIVGDVNTYATGGNNFILLGNLWEIGPNDVINLYDRSYEPNSVVYSYLKVYGTFTTCNKVTLTSGKIIARRIPGSFPFVYNYYVAPVKNNKEERIIVEYFE